LSERSFPFDGSVGYLSDEDWSQLARIWQEDGVIAATHGGTELKVKSGSVPDEILISAGRAHIRGFYYHNDADLGLVLNLNAGTSARYDLVVLRLDVALNSVSAAIKEGVPGGPEPVPTQNDSVYELPLARLTVPANSAPVTTFVDRRPFIGRRVQVSENGSQLAPGNIYYKPSLGSFFLNDQRGSGREMASMADTGARICTSTTRPTDLREGQFIFETDTKLTYVYRNWTFHLVGGETPAKPIAVLRKSTSQAVASNSQTFITWDVEDVDTDNGHNNSSSNTRYFAKRAGWYRVSLNAMMDGATNGSRKLEIHKNSVLNGAVVAMAYPTNSDATFFSASGLMRLMVNDYVEVEAWQTSGSTLNIWGSNYARFEIEWVAPTL
jgi:hypothetical protein